ncbi:MAG: DUF456 domain-containing protein [Bacillota bacterium]
MTILGVAGTLLPVLPGTPIIVIAALIFGLINQFQLISVNLILGLIGLSILAESLEYLLSVIGAKQFGASRYGVIGSISGGILGAVILGPVGIFLGLILGSIVIELLLGKRFQEAVRTGLGALIGAAGGSLFAFIISLVMASLLISRIL